ncbi:unnamed protein product [Schistocephalus solidus]|uniref:Ran GTPase-activating protein 1 n=1 Tax=Schistocephalus solidus TaxID=70667 RepID=A0A183STK9_SCHSO|nr:unnamed protein product [Schistocephalus solidus]
MPVEVLAEDAIVDFADNSLKIDGKKDANPIVLAMKKCPQMTVLRLSGNTLGVEGAEAIGSQLSNHPSLTRCLFSDLFTGRMVDEIAPALRHLSAGIISAGAQLTELDLSDNAFGPRGVVGVTELLSSPVCYTLRTLKMNNQGLGHQGCRYLTEALLKGLRDSKGSGPKLKTFSAGRNRLENYGAKLLADVFSEMKSLEELHLYQNGIGIHGMDGIQCLVNAIALNPNLRVLNLSDNSLTADGGTELAKSLSHLPNLEELILDDCLIRGRGCRSLANEIEREDVVPNLKCLRLYGNEITRDAGVHLALCLEAKTKLKHLNLNANEFGSEGIDMVIRTLESIGLIEALDVPPGDRSTEDSVSDDLDPRYRAFDEDQGSDNEDEEGDDDFEEGEYNDSEEAGDFEDEELSRTQSSFHSSGKSGDSSFQTVKERSVGGPFGYASLSNDLKSMKNGSLELPAKVENFKTWSSTALKCTKQVIEEKLGTTTPTRDPEIEAKVGVLK